MNNSEFANTLNDNFICTYKQVSTFYVHSSPQQKRKKRAGEGHKKGNANVIKNGGNIISYFCDSSARVIEIVVGPDFKNANAAANRAAKFHKVLASSPATEHSKLAKAYVRELLDIETEKALFEARKNHSVPVQFANRIVPPNNETGKPAAIREVLITSQAALDSAGGNLARKLMSCDLSEFRWRIQHHENLLLSKYQLPNISEIEKPAFEVLTGNQYSVASPEFDQRLQQFEDAANSDKFVLAIMLDDHQVPGLNRTRQFTPPDVNKVISFNGIKNKLEQFEIVTVTHDDLFRILSELEKDPMIFKMYRKVAKSGIGYIVFDREANVVKLLPPDSRLSTVNRFIKLAASK